MLLLLVRARTETVVTSQTDLDSLVQKTAEDQAPQDL